MQTIQSRFILGLFKGIKTSDGAGVELIRLIGQPKLDNLDPFLLFDNFKSEDKQDYIAGFPSHPHRGFETVTYLLAGKMRHKDSAGHEGLIEQGGVQWMTAGRGIIHSEMPEQEKGLLQGFQLWINLPSKNKMMSPKYQEYSEKEIPTELRPDGSVIKVIAGRVSSGLKGPVEQPLTNPMYIDISMPINSEFCESIPGDHSAFIFVIEGGLVALTEENKKVEVDEGVICTLSKGKIIKIWTKNKSARFLLIAGRPLGEPIVRYGPFVMNTQEEINKAFEDYSKGEF